MTRTVHFDPHNSPYEVLDCLIDTYKKLQRDSAGEIREGYFADKVATITQYRKADEDTLARIQCRIDAFTHELGGLLFEEDRHMILDTLTDLDQQLNLLKERIATRSIKS